MGKFQYVLKESLKRLFVLTTAAALIGIPGKMIYEDIQRENFEKRTYDYFIDGNWKSFIDRDDDGKYDEVEIYREVITRKGYVTGFHYELDKRLTDKDPEFASHLDIKTNRPKGKSLDFNSNW